MKRNDFRFVAIVTPRTTQYKFYETTTTQNRGTCAQRVEHGTCIIPWNMRHVEHHQLDGGPGETLQVYRGANLDENATAIVKS